MCVCAVATYWCACSGPCASRLCVFPVSPRFLSLRSHEFDLACDDCFCLIAFCFGCLLIRVAELNCTACVVVFAEQIPEESTMTVEAVKVEEVTSEEVKPADLQFLTPVTPQLRTISEKELQLE